MLRDPTGREDGSLALDLLFALFISQTLGQSRSVSNFMVLLSNPPSK